MKQSSCCQQDQFYWNINILLIKKVKEAINPTISEKLRIVFQFFLYRITWITLNFCSLPVIKTECSSLWFYDNRPAAELSPDRACSRWPLCWSGYKPRTPQGFGEEESHCWPARLTPVTNIWKCERTHKISCSRTEKEHRRGNQSTPGESFCNITNDVLQVDGCTFTVPSEDALMMWEPSWVKEASFTKDEWPSNSLSVFPDLSSWILKKNDITD